MFGGVDESSADAFGGARRMPEIEVLRGPTVYPVPDPDLLIEVQTAPEKNLPETAQEAMACLEGLEIGRRPNLENPVVVLFLLNLFTTVESATARSPNLYLATALYNRLVVPTRQYNRMRREVGAGDREREEEVEELLRIYSTWQARKILDAAFCERMRACDNDKKMADLLNSTVKPDKGHWACLLSGPFGYGVERAFRRIVTAGLSTEKLVELRSKLPPIVRKRMKALGKGHEEIESRIRDLLEDLQPPPPLDATPDGFADRLAPDIYARGFRDHEEFGHWLRYVAKGTDGKIDEVFTAWKLALLWEVISALGVSVESDGRIRFGEPPLMGDLMVWAIHLHLKRLTEWGLDDKGNRLQFSRYLTHTGYPASIRIKGPLVDHFLASAVVSIKGVPDENIPGEETTLWDLWFEYGYSLGELPWAMTEQQPSGWDVGEPPPGTFAYWRLQLLRAFSVIEDLRGLPTMKDLQERNFFALRVRNWDKIFGTYEKFLKIHGREMDPEENPRVWWVMGIIIDHYFKEKDLKKSFPLAKEEGEEIFLQTRMPSEQLSVAHPGRVGEPRNVSLWELMEHAYQCGFLRPVDINFITDKLKLNINPQLLGFDVRPNIPGVNSSFSKNQ